MHCLPLAHPEINARQLPQVSRSGVYSWRKRGQVVCKLDDQVKQAFNRLKKRAGAPSLTADIRADGFTASERTVGRSLRKQGLRCRQKRKFRLTTDSNHRYSVATNLLNRNFTVSKPNVAWMGDITYGTPRQRSPPARGGGEAA
jgi:transposase InsO family protein